MFGGKMLIKKGLKYILGCVPTHSDDVEMIIPDIRLDSEPTPEMLWGKYLSLRRKMLTEIDLRKELPAECDYGFSFECPIQIETKEDYDSVIEFAENLIQNNVNSGDTTFEPYLNIDCEYKILIDIYMKKVVDWSRLPSYSEEERNYFIYVLDTVNEKPNSFELKATNLTELIEKAEKQLGENEVIYAVYMNDGIRTDPKLVYKKEPEEITEGDHSSKVEPSAHNRQDGGSNPSDPTISFSLSSAELQKFTQWDKNHICDLKNDSGTIGGRLSFIFTPTSLGVLVEVRCGCGETVKLTNMSEL